MTASKNAKTENSSKALAQPLAVIGMSCMFPKAETLRSYWANIKNKVDAIEGIPETHWKVSDYYDENAKTPDMTIGRTGGFLPKLAFDPTEWGMLPDAIEATDTTQLYGLVVANAALMDAGYGTDRDFDRERVSVLLGITGTLELSLPLAARLGHPKWRRALREAGVPDDVAEEVVANIGDSYVSWQENSFPGLLGNVTAGRIANRLDLHGSNCVTDAACASSLSAAHLACLELQTGHADMVITGGCDTFNDIFMFMCFTKTPALSPTGHARPLSNKADGTILGEGVGMVVLKRLEDAEKAGDKIYATIRGMGSSSDGKGKSIYAPSAAGQARCLREAHRQSGIDPRDIELMECHGTGTKVGDATEFEGLHSVFPQAGEEGPWCAIGSVKSQIGHCKASAGTAGLMKTILAVHHKVLPPTIKVDEPAEQFLSADTPFYVNVDPRPWLPRDGKARVAGVSAFGFGGSNYHAIVEEYGRKKDAPDWDGGVEILALSGRSSSEIKSALASAAKAKDWRALRIEAARSRAAFDCKAKHRLLTVLQEGKSHGEALDKLSAMIDKRQGEASWSTPDGSHYSSAPAAEGKLAFVFPGQGAQYVGMGRESACLFPEMLETLSEANAVWGSDAKGRRLSDFIYPHSLWNEADRKAAEDALTATEVAQPAIGAVSLGLMKVLSRFGLAPDATAGHSYGELVALAAAGRISPEELHRLSKLRGELMARGEGDRGSMLAARCSEADAQKLIDEEKLDLVIANKNTPMQMVLSGSTAEIDRAVAACKSRKIRGTKLQVAAAFHSKLVSDAAVPFEKALGDVTFAEGSATVYANSNGAAYPKAAADCRNVLGGQLACSVEWVKLVEAMYADGVRSFVEVGPGKRIGGMLGAILEGKEHLAVALDASSGRKGAIADLARALVSLAAAGHPVDLKPWADGEAFLVAEERRRKPRLTVEICGANYRNPKRKKTALPPRPKELPPLKALPSSMAPKAATAPAPAPLPAARPTTAPATVPAAPQQATAVAAPPAFHPSLQLTQDSLVAIAQMQARTAELHKAFLEGQEQAQRTLQALVSQGAPLTTLPVQAPVTTPVAQFGSPAPRPPAPPVASVAPKAVARVAAPRPQAAKVTAPQAARVTAPKAAMVAAAKASTAPSLERVKTVVLEIVAEKTGYPVEMLDPSMDMEADLGIDSIKRVEIMSAVQEKLPNAPVVQPDQVGSLKTLADILAVLEEMEAAPAASISSSSPSSPSPSPSPSSSAPSLAQIQAVLMEVVAEKTGYPSEMLDTSMDMEADLGIDSIKRVEIMSAVQEKLPDAPVVQPDQVGNLRTLADILAVLESMEAAPAASISSSSPSSPSPSSSSPAPTVDAARIREVLLAVVGEKTGYPTEMLEDEMDMEADLGIDSIKRVEIMSAIQEQLPDAPVVQPDEVGSLKTLKDIVGLLTDAAPAAAVSSPSSPSPSSPPPSASDTAAFEAALLEIVSEKTGYPAEMLEADMDMEADLGIDSIKRVEILSSFQERMPNAPVVQPEAIGDFRTLQQVIAYLKTNSGRSLQPDSMTSTVEETVDEDDGASFRLSRKALRAERFETEGKPVWLGLPEGAPIWVTQDGTKLAPAVVAELASRGHAAELVSLQSVSELEAPEGLAGLVLIAPVTPLEGKDMTRSDSRELLDRAFALSQKAGPALRATAERKAALFATVSRFDGRFGLRTWVEGFDPAMGALAGLSKTVGHEWDSCTARAFDLARGWDEKKAAPALVEAMLQAGPVELGLGPDGMVQLHERESCPRPRDEAPLEEGDLVLVSGGARGVTADCAVTIARRWKPTMVLLGRSPAPVAEPSWLKSLTEQAAMKKAILANATSPMKPKDLEKAYRGWCSGREIQATLDRISAVGGQAVYLSVDVRDASALGEKLDELRASHGPVRGLVHGAGVLRDKRIEDKLPEHFDAVYGTKVDGLQALLEAVGEDELRCMAFFSSSTGRYGRTGQVDYAMANECLNKVARQQARKRPDCRVVSIGWGPWAGGMVTPELEKLFAAEGVGLIPLAAGARLLADELAAVPEASIEIVVGAFPEGEEPGEADPDPFEESEARVSQNLSLAFERTLRAKEWACLDSHVINGDYVMPVALIMEWLAQGALHENPGYAFHGFDGLRVTRGLVFDGSKAVPVAVWAGKAGKGKAPVVAVELRSGDGAIVHARAQVHLRGKLPVATAPVLEAPMGRSYPISVGEAYEEVLFHGSHFRGIESVEGCTPDGITARVKGAPAPAKWMESPLRSDWLADPLVMDTAFQLMILWTHDQAGELSLPSYLGSYRQFVSHFPAKVQTVIRAHHGGLMTVKADMEFLDEEGRLLARIEGYECVMSPGLRESFARRRPGAR